MDFRSVIICVLGLIIAIHWVRIANQDRKHYEVNFYDCAISGILSLTFNFFIGMSAVTFLSILLFLACLFANDTSKYVGAADLLIPINFLCCYVGLSEELNSILIILATFIFMLGLYLLLHKKIVGIEWEVGKCTAGLPPYAMTVVLINLVWVPFVVLH